MDQTLISNSLNFVSNTFCMNDEIPIFDESSETKTLHVGNTSIPKKSSLASSKKLTPQDELNQLVAGDINEGVLINDLVSAKGVASQMAPIKQPEDFDQFAKEVIEKSGLQIKNPIVIKRFSLVLKSYFNKVRKLSQVKAFIVKKIQFGGMGLDKEKAEILISVLQGKSVAKEPEIPKPQEKPLQPASPLTSPTKINSEGTTKNSANKGFFQEMVHQIRTEKVEDVGPLEESASLAPINASIEKNVPEKTKKEIEKISESENKNTFNAPPSKAPVSNNPQQKMKGALLRAKNAVIPMTDKKTQTVSIPKKREVPKPAPAVKKQETPVTNSAPVPRPKQMPETPKPVEPKVKSQVAEVPSQLVSPANLEVPESKTKKVETRPDLPSAYASRLVGPVEELRYTMKDFRRLAKNPVDRSKKIEAKVKLLEEESFSNKYLGIRSWLASDVIRQYISVGKRAIEERRSVDEILKEEQGKNKAALSREEFNAISQINATLKS